MANGEVAYLLNFFSITTAAQNRQKSARIDGSGTCGGTAAHAGADTGGIEPEVTCAMLSEIFTDSTPVNRL